MVSGQGLQLGDAERLQFYWTCGERTGWCHVDIGAARACKAKVASKGVVLRRWRGRWRKPRPLRVRLLAARGLRSRALRTCLEQRWGCRTGPHRGWRTDGFRDIRSGGSYCGCGGGGGGNSSGTRSLPYRPDWNSPSTNVPANAVLPSGKMYTMSSPDKLPLPSTKPITLPLYSSKTSAIPTGLSCSYRPRKTRRPVLALTFVAGLLSLPSVYQPERRVSLKGSYRVHLPDGWPHSKVPLQTYPLGNVSSPWLWNFPLWSSPV
mmetsp:Transcript_79907/g.175253  ORF Transcript_79907/g.175253 Transcript_79907/m.175253 type:complete len:263 (-) Transcript_79907:308-1096(-)